MKGSKEDMDKYKCDKGTIGRPRFNYNDKVGFYINNEFIIGEVYIIDAYGTFEQDEEPSYDIMVTTANLLVKHVRESWCYDLRNYEEEC